MSRVVGAPGTRASLPQEKLPVLHDKSNISISVMIISYPVGGTAKSIGKA
jgi:hypothetical protein